MTAPSGSSVTPERIIQFAWGYVSPLVSTDVTVPQNPGLGVKMHVNSGYPFEDGYQMTRHVISIMHTFLNDAQITHPTTQ
ncbi:MAG: hypothetical protein ABI197_00330 [Granulicella sp.]